MQKTKKLYDILYIIIFCCLISVPLIFINRDSDAISFLENKKLATIPQILSEGRINKNYISEFEEYIDDNIGFKQKAIEYNLALVYRLFDKIDINNYIEGKQGNIFYTNNGYGIKVWQGEVQYSDEQKNTFLQSILEFNNTVIENNGKLILMGIPDKENIYPEFYPKNILRISDETQLDNLLKYVSDNTDIAVLPMKESLLKTKEKLGTERIDDYLYYKTYDSTHWNNKGAWVGYNVLMDAVQKDFPKIDRLKESEVKLIPQEVETLEFLQKSELLKKEINLPDVKYDFTIKDNMSREADYNELTGFQLQQGDIYFHYKNDSVSDGKDIMIIGDSYVYSTLILPALAESFANVYFIQSNAEQDINLFKAVKPDILVYEFVERAFYYDVAINMMNNFIN